MNNATQTAATSRPMSPLAPSPMRIQALRSIRDDHPGLAGSQQCERLMHALKTMGSVTTFEASRYLDIYDPRARASDLRKAGHTLMTVMESAITESGEKHRIGRYSLVRGAKC